MSDQSPTQISATSPVARFRFGLGAITLMLAMAFIVTWGASVKTAHAATTAFTQCDGENASAGLELDCDVDVVNNINVATGAKSSTVTTTTCRGFAHACLAPVVTVINNPTDAVGSVDQCNGSLFLGGSRVICNVTVTNNITGVGATRPVTVNECVGTGGGGGTAMTCDPNTPTSGADIDQCNGSAYGGDALVDCSVDGLSTSADLWLVTIDQCNGSAYGGGGTLICKARVTNVIVAPTPADTTPPGGGGGDTTPPSDGGGGTTPSGGGGGGTTPSGGAGGGTTPSGGAGGATTVAGGGSGATTVPGGGVNSVAATTPIGDETTVPSSETTLPSSETTGFVPTNITLPVTGSHVGTTAAAGTIVLLVGIGTLLVLPRIPRRRQR